MWGLISFVRLVAFLAICAALYTWFDEGRYQKGHALYHPPERVVFYFLLTKIAFPRQEVRKSWSDTYICLPFLCERFSGSCI